ncbi:MAG TPA: CcoQ/FixQ family Cbb3-type cytochrome c oxidase assembly chaperone [Cyclobacteriaceae bacterium]
MESITGIEIYPVLSFLIFFIFFLVLTIWVINTKKRDLEEVANLPIDETDSNKE